MMETNGKAQGLGMGTSGLVSVVIPTYRRVPELKLAVASSLAQTYSNIEVIVVADGPDAEARAALEGMEKADLDGKVSR
ncbi:MAG: glycosyltransferase, partial [Acidobacteriota bacterium]